MALEKRKCFIDFGHLSVSPSDSCWRAGETKIVHCMRREVAQLGASLSGTFLQVWLQHQCSLPIVLLMQPNRKAKHPLKRRLELLVSKVSMLVQSIQNFRRCSWHHHVVRATTNLSNVWHVHQKVERVANDRQADPLSPPLEEEVNFLAKQVRSKASMSAV